MMLKQSTFAFKNRFALFFAWPLVTICMRSYVGLEVRLDSILDVSIIKYPKYLVKSHLIVAHDQVHGSHTLEADLQVIEITYI